MKPKEAEMMEIDLDDEQVPQTPPRLHSINKDGKVESKAGTMSAMAIDCDSTPPNTPGRKEDKGQKKASPSKKKGGPKLALSKKEKQTLSKWPKTPYKPEDIFGEGDSLHDHEKLVRVNITNFAGSGCPKVEQ